MTKLSDTQAVILSAAAQRDDGAVLPLPDTLKIKGGAVNKVLGSLKAKGLIDRQGTPRGDDPPPLRITRAGLQAIGVEPEDTGSDTAPPEADTGATPADAGAQAVKAPAKATEADGAATPAKKGKLAKPEGKKTTTTARVRSEPGAAPAGESSVKSTPRAGTKQALMIKMLERPEDATVEQIAAATGWQHHTIRGASAARSRRSSGSLLRPPARARSAPRRPVPRAARPCTGSSGQARAQVRVRRLTRRRRPAERPECHHGGLAQATGLPALCAGQPRG
jgi:Protein of unknown function (DUF3489)